MLIYVQTDESIVAEVLQKRKLVWVTEINDATVRLFIHSSTREKVMRQSLFV